MNDAVTWHKAADPGELADGELKAVVVAGTQVVLVRVGERYRALDDRCPHAGGPLSQGCIENGLLVCPWHGREYDLETGRCEGFQPVRTFPVEVRADGIFVAS
jgi:nitrite reductase/ring-hydroxylating ferredoxin subunit